MSKSAKLMMILLSLSLVLVAGLMIGAIKSERWEITELDINANFERISSEQIRLAIAASPERSFFKIDIEEIKSNLKDIPWVQKVNVIKKWPNTLIIKLIEQKAIAVWNSNQLLNESGEIFKVETSDNLDALPLISGTDSQSKEILSKFLRYSELLNDTGSEITEAKISPRGSWVLDMSNGITIYLGTTHKDSRIIRLVETWVNLLKQKDLPPEYIDLRYTNGYVVKWQKDKNQSIQQSELEQING